MRYICKNKKCKRVWLYSKHKKGEANEGKICPKCGGTDILVQGNKK